MAKTKWSVEEARERMRYEPDTGRLIWKKCRNPNYIGKESRSLDVSGYVQVNIGPGLVLKGHRIAWAIHYGEWPTLAVDHINGNRADNRISNLRLVTHAMNCHNMRNGSTKSATGLLGVSISPRSAPAKRYRAKIVKDGKQFHLGGYPTPELAHEAYVAAKRRMHEGNTL